jgi:adenine deaminase
LNSARILGIENLTGSLEVGKDANIVISTGDILDMRTNNITHAFIQGRNLDLNDKRNNYTGLSINTTRSSRMQVAGCRMQVQKIYFSYR